MPEAAVAEPPAAPPPPVAEPSDATSSASAAEMDKILNSFGAMPTSETPPSDPPAQGQPQDPPPPAEPAKQPDPAPPPPAEDDGLTPPPPPAAADPVDDKYGTIPDKPGRGFKSEDEKVNWGKFRDAHETLKRDLRAAQEQLGKAPAPDENTQAQINSLTERNAQLAAIVEEIAAERLPFVETEFNQPLDREIRLAQKELENVGAEPGTLERILALGGKDRADALKQLYSEIDNEYTKSTLAASMREISRLQDKKSDFLKDRKGAVEKRIQDQKAEQFRQSAEREKGIKQAIGDIVGKLSEQFEYLRPTNAPGWEKWNERIKNDLQEVENLALRETDPMKLIAAIVLSKQALYERQGRLKAIERATKAEAKIKELEGALPHSGADRVAVNGEGKGNDADKYGILPTDDLATAAQKMAKGMMAERR